MQRTRLRKFKHARLLKKHCLRKIKSFHNYNMLSMNISTCSKNKKQNQDDWKRETAGFNYI